ncbi:MAG TPA: GNAT family N-acyltransferase [Spirochaetota bacterium]|nr:GNAT family N-acyltransferase [Spirochaetota bacterium]HNT11105.1 GNAT family N-acyltransferase [Spirochaetota bacterium]
MTTTTSTQPGERFIPGKIDFFTNLRLMSDFRRKVAVYLEKDNFIIKTAENSDEVNEALRLRYEVFQKEMLGRRSIFGIDIDRYDSLADHLILIDTNINSIVGTYRLISSVYADKFYSQNEFNISGLLRRDGSKLELGRACIQKAYRNSNMIANLWMGLGEYINATKARYLFGCSSVSTTDPLEIAMLHRYLNRYHAVAPDLRVQPLRKYRIKRLEEYLAQVERSADLSNDEIAKKKVPALITSYLLAGAKIGGEPALDMSFKCADFFTVLDFEAVNQGYVDARMETKTSVS